MTKTEPPFPLNVKVTSTVVSSSVVGPPAPVTHRLKTGEASDAVEDEVPVLNTRTSTM